MNDPTIDNWQKDDAAEDTYVTGKKIYSALKWSLLSVIVIKRISNPNFLITGIRTHA